MNLPFQRAFEITALGHILMGDTLPLDRLQAKHFHLDSDQEIFAVALELHQQGSAPDVGRVADVLTRSNRLLQIGDVAYLCSLTEGIVVSNNIAHECDALVRTWTQRELDVLGRRISSSAQDGASLSAVQTLVQETFTNLNGHHKGPVKLETLGVKRGRDIVRREQKWTVPDFLAEGTLETLVGEVGIGKTTFATALCADVSRGRIPIIGGDMEPRNVLILSNEDSEAHLLATFERMGGDVDRLYVEDEDSETPWNLGCIATLEEWIKRYEPAIVVIDSLSSYCPEDVNLNHHPDTARLLVPVRKLGSAYNFLPLLIAHDNKAQTDDAIRKTAGSKGVTGTARHNLYVGKDPNDDNIRIAATFKTNIARDRNRAYRFQLDPFQWLGRSSLTAQELLRSQMANPPEERPEPANKLEAAKVWLIEYLKNGREEISTIVKEAAEAEAGIKKRTLERTAEKLIEVTRDPGGKTWWKLRREPCAKPEPIPY